MWGIIILVILIVINGYFTAARRALTSINRAAVRDLIEEGNDKAKAILPIIDEPNKYKLAIRSLNFVICTVSTFIALKIFLVPACNLLEHLGVELTDLSTSITAIIIILIYCFFLISFGEVFPRRLAVIFDEKIALKTAGSVKVFTVIMAPLTTLVSALVFVLLKILRLRTDLNDNEYSEDDIVEMLEAGQVSGELKEEGKKMITGVFAFDDILAYEIMTPRTDVFAIDINDPAEEYIDELMELRYSRIPVYEDDQDNIIGILYIKDYLIKARTDGFDHVDFREILRKPYLVPETKNIDSLFFELQKTKQHIAILIDEYGGFCGIVTMEDIIEEVMGDIDDEYDEEEQELQKIGDNLYIVEGGMNLDDLNEELGINIQSDAAETIGGFIIDMFGEIPDEDDIGKEIFYEQYVFTIKSVKDRRIEQITLKILPVIEDKDKIDYIEGQEYKKANKKTKK
ncbi:MAG: hemolysin family protein [Firmicutes bacterium]|nr:hemolysin family protein [Bacillota bacterium]